MVTVYQIQPLNFLKLFQNLDLVELVPLPLSLDGTDYYSLDEQTFNNNNRLLLTLTGILYYMYMYM